MVRSPLMFFGGMLVGAAIVGGVVSQRAVADPVRCDHVATRAPDASVLPPEPLPPLDSEGTVSGVAGPSSAGAGTPATTTIRTPAR